MNAKTLLIGSGICAHRIAEDILAQDPELIIASRETDFDLSPDSLRAPGAGESATVFTNATVRSCHGTVGDFTVTLDCNGEKQIAAVERVIIAEDEKRVPNFSGYNLNRTDTVMAISRLKELLEEPAGDRNPFSGINTVAFLVGLHSESNPVIFEEVMRSCLELQTDHALKTYILTGNLKVAADGMERMYRRTKDAGVVYIKFTDTRPDIVQAADGGVRFEFADEITGLQCRLTADMTVVDEEIAPSDYTTDLTRIFELDQDLNGFAQSDNVHRLTTLTNRKGILAAGSARSVQSIPDQLIDAGNTVLSLLKKESVTADQMAGKARIDTGKCVRCLTCHRLCPHRAIQVNARLAVVTQACEGCGICLAECPRGAISFEKQEPAADSLESPGETIPPANDSFVPSITAFCCSRSAAHAAELAACMQKKLPQGLRIVEVPCGGSVSLNDILTAFKSSADGILVLTCHGGNCHSERGPDHARERVAQITELFRSIGLERDRLVHKTLASNMGAEFAGTVAEFEAQLLELGPNRLKG